MTYQSGNAEELGRRGWLVGHFMEPGLQQTAALEVKWGSHPAGEIRHAWTDGETRTTLIVSVSGQFRIDLKNGPDAEVRGVLLARPGDFVTWGPGTEHSWEAVTDSVVVAVRWPSFEGFDHP